MGTAPKINVSDLVRDAAIQYADDPCLTHKNTTFTYSELWHSICAFASGLDAIGVKRNDRVGIFLDKSIEAVVASFGSSAASAVFVLINPQLKPHQVIYIMHDCDVRILVTSSEKLARLQALKPEPHLAEYVILVDAHSDPQDLHYNYDYKLYTWCAFGRGDRGETRRVATVESDMAAILYTSGSTGKPKGVVVSHRNLIAGAESVCYYIGNNSSDTILSVLPISFDAGLSQLTTGFTVGAHIILIDYVMPDDVVRVCRKHRVTGITGVPPFWNQIAGINWPQDVAAQLRYFANTGGNMSRDTLDSLRRLFPKARPYLMYGLTEAFRSTYLEPAEIDRKPGSIGKAVPNAEILILRPDGSPCDPGEPGELVHRGPLVAMGYWNDPVLTAERFRRCPVNEAEGCSYERAVFSGDIVVSDADGFLYFVGRQDEMIKTSGYRVSPTEIEEIAYSAGFISAAVALGVYDPAIGQRIVLVVTPKNQSPVDISALLNVYRDQLPKYMVPSCVIEMSAIPTSPNGKFDRISLRALLKQ